MHPAADVNSVTIITELSGLDALRADWFDLLRVQFGRLTTPPMGMSADLVEKCMDQIMRVSDSVYGSLPSGGPPDRSAFCRSI
jgi:hypothetical protein